MLSDKRIEKLLETAKSFVSFLEMQRGHEPGISELIDVYSVVRREMALVLLELTSEGFLPSANAAVSDAIERIEKHAQARFPERAPKALKVKGHRGIHGILLHYLVQHVGRPVKGSTLRILAGDQVHTERRARELRDLGYDIRISTVAGESAYTLLSADQDLDRAVEYFFGTE
jgi:hypothetical protein